MPNPPYSYVSYRIDADMIADPTFSYASFDVLPDGTVPEQDQVDVYLNGDLLVLDTDYTLDDTTSTITVISTLTLEDFLQIKRDTQKTARYVNFTDNSVLTEADLDLDSNQLFFLVQEAWDLANDSIHKSDDGLTWEGQGLEASNFAPATQNSSLVTLAQVYNLLSGSLTASIDGCFEWNEPGTGSTKVIALTGAPLGMDSCNFLVTVDGVVVPPDDYTITTLYGVAQLTFLVDPPNGSDIWVRSYSGLVAAALPDLSITNAKIADYTIDITKLAKVPAATNKLLVFGNDGTARRDLINVSFLTDFNAATLAFKPNQFALCTSNFNVNNNKIVNLTAGTASSDACNYGQMVSYVGSSVSAFNASVTSITNKIAGGYNQNFYGIQPDLYFQTYNDARTSGSAVFVGTPARYLTDTIATSALTTGFVPRRMTILISGSIRNASDNTQHVSGTTTREFRFIRWDEENGYTNSSLSGNIRTYTLTPVTVGTGTSSAVTNTTFELDVEFVSPYRTWLRIKRTDTNALLVVRNPSNTAVDGTVQVIAERGL